MYREWKKIKFPKVYYICDINFVFLFSTVTMMHGPINIRFRHNIFTFISDKN